jgi:hypothetical protein
MTDPAAPDPYRPESASPAPATPEEAAPDSPTVADEAPVSDSDEASAPDASATADPAVTADSSAAADEAPVLDDASAPDASAPASPAAVTADSSLADESPASAEEPAADATPGPAADSSAASDEVSAQEASDAAPPAAETADSSAVAGEVPVFDEAPVSDEAVRAVPAADPLVVAESGPAAESLAAADLGPGAEPAPGSGSGPAAQAQAGNSAPAASETPVDLPSAARNGSARNGSGRPASNDPWAVASAESATGHVAGPEPASAPAGSPVSAPDPSAAERAASGTGWPDPAPARGAASSAAGSAEPAVDTEALTGKVAPLSGRRPSDRRKESSADAWGAATDPIGTSGRRSAEAGGARDGTPSRDAAASRAPAPRRDAGRTADRDRTRSAPGGRPVARRPESRRSGPGGDLLGDMQRWLIRSGTKSMRREIEGQVRRTLGGGRRAEPADPWGTATTEPPPHLGESPECAWCPICRAARRMRESGPDLGSQLSGASDVVASAVQDAIVAVDAIFSRTAAAPGPRRPAGASSDSGRADSAGDPAERVSDEPGDRG